MKVSAKHSRKLEFQEMVLLQSNELPNMLSNKIIVAFPKQTTSVNVITSIIENWIVENSYQLFCIRDCISHLVIYTPSAHVRESFITWVNDMDFNVLEDNVDQLDYFR